jgi:hypothetical protein
MSRYFNRGKPARMLKGPIVGPGEFMDRSAAFALSRLDALIGEWGLGLPGW